MNLANIVVKPDGPLSVELFAPHFPQTPAGVLWRYDSAQQPEGKAGEFSPGVPSVSLGSPASVAGKYFLLEGVVLNQGDNPPTPYQVQVSILQAGVPVHQEVPPDGGSGQIGTADVPFVYRFKIGVAS